MVDCRQSFLWALSTSQQTFPAALGVNLFFPFFILLHCSILRSIDKACHVLTAAAGQQEMLQLFSQLSSPTSTKDNHAPKKTRQAAAARNKEDAFCLTRKDNTSWSSPSAGLQVIWNYDEQHPIEEAATQLPYVASNGHAQMERFRGRMNPRTMALESTQLLTEKRRVR